MQLANHHVRICPVAWVIQLSTIYFQTELHDIKVGQGIGKSDVPSLCHKFTLYCLKRSQRQRGTVTLTPMVF